MKSDTSNRAPLNRTFREGSSGRTARQERAVAATTHEALDGYREKAMRIANDEDDTLNWVSISSAGTLDITHCVFSVRSARDEMRHITGSSEPDAIIGSDRDQNRGVQERRTKIKWNSCANSMRGAGGVRSLLRA